MRPVGAAVSAAIFDHVDREQPGVGFSRFMPRSTLIVLCVFNRFHDSQSNSFFDFGSFH